jgi:hypothetical protein
VNFPVTNSDMSLYLISIMKCCFMKKDMVKAVAVISFKAFHELLAHFSTIWTIFVNSAAYVSGI